MLYGVRSKRQEATYKADHKIENRQTHTRQSQEKQDKMEAEQSPAQAIMQAAIEATKAAVMVAREADNIVSSARPIHTMPRSGGPLLRQQTFN